MGQINVTLDSQPIGMVESKNPLISGSYIASITDVVGVVAANNYMALFNGAGTKLIIVTGIFISTYVTSGSSSARNSMQGQLITTATGGTNAASTIAKFDSTMPAATGTLLTGNPTVTLGNNVFNSPPPVNSSNGQYVHSVGDGVPVLAGALTLRANEGIVIRSAAGNAAQTWNISMVWSEI